MYFCLTAYTSTLLVKSILMEIVPDLSSNNDSKFFEYHYSKSEIASGYGRSWDWENNDNY
ncbi:hypothetical protein HMPREF9151_00686 [Hoylesella saccharolytica F0055]|uniref:Uncharacterized protein n=1 Tax=Hoylesella saccharolytica F0055 TaxID=1127699 RepID=L1NH33_9BACT|nr:hypothetical protein HMPREF9151_00686 [Hoylesella saccharolytica F0055]